MRRCVAIAQMCSSCDKIQNFEIAKKLVIEAKAKGASFVCFPEAFDFIGKHSLEENIAQAEYLDGPTMNLYCSLARDEKVWLSLGGFHEKINESSQKIANTHCIVDDNGKIVRTYRKIHLFDVDYDGGFRESNSTVPGNEVVVIKDTPIGNIGLSTCYDLRFPELYTTLRDMGAQVILAPSGTFVISTHG